MSFNPENNEPIDLTFDKIVSQTEKAFLVDIDGEQAWVAKSQVENAEELEEEFKAPSHKRKGLDTITVPRWLAVANGWCDNE